MTKRPLIASAILFAAASIPLVVPSLTAQQVDRAHQIGGKFMCMCSCNQVLTQCNHVGCTTSTAMLKQVDQGLARGDSEDTITQAFVQEFGTKVYAEPPHSLRVQLASWARDRSRLRETASRPSRSKRSPLVYTLVHGTT